MSKNNDDLFGGFFDFNGDGKTSIDEEWIAYQIMEDVNDSTDEEPNYSPPQPTPSYVNQPAEPVSDEAQLSTVMAAPNREQYKNERGGYRVWIIVICVFFLFILIVPIGVMYAAVTAYDERNSASLLATFILIAIGLIAIGCPIRLMYPEIRITVLKLRRLKTNYINAMDDTERTRFLKKKKKRKIVLWSIMGAILFTVFSLLIANYIQTASIYEQAESLIISADYVNAKELLSQIENSEYKDTKSLISLCKAYEAYDNGNPAEAYSALKFLRFKHQDEEQLNTIEQFKETINAEYKKYTAQKAAEQEREYNRKVNNGVPFVGMAEKSIYKTILGAPSSTVRHNSECINGRQYLANLYDFYRDGKLIFTARCVNGQVTDVFDERNTTSYVPEYSNYGKKDDRSDPYNINDYAHAEDFYYDYYDDFFDYEDAEDYYNEHHE